MFTPRKDRKKWMAKAGAPANATPAARPVADIPPEYQDTEKTPLTHDTGKGSRYDIAIP